MNLQKLKSLPEKRTPVKSACVKSQPAKKSSPKKESVKSKKKIKEPVKSKKKTQCNKGPVKPKKKKLPKKDSVKSKKDSNKIIIEVDKNENKLLYSDKLKHLIYKIKNQDINTDKVTFGW